MVPSVFMIISRSRSHDLDQGRPNFGLTLAKIFICWPQSSNILHTVMEIRYVIWSLSQYMIMSMIPCQDQSVLVKVKHTVVKVKHIYLMTFDTMNNYRQTIHYYAMLLHIMLCYFIIHCNMIMIEANPNTRFMCCSIVP